MTTIPLPLDRAVRLFGLGLPLCAAILVLFCQIAWPWRVAAAGVVVLSGALLWWRHLQRRPVSLTIETGGSLRCLLADGRSLEVVRVLPGIIRPSLLCSRLECGGGERCDLLVPGGSLPESAHWQLRRALIGFRPGQSGYGPADDAGRSGPGSRR